MAVRSSCHHRPSSSMTTCPRLGARKPATLRFTTSAPAIHSCRSSHQQQPTTNKVFEDELRGIVCYGDEKGELVCEGYDEGPRLGMRLPERACFPWPVDVEATDFIQLSTLLVFEDSNVQKGLL